MDADFAHLT